MTAEHETGWPGQALNAAIEAGLNTRPGHEGPDGAQYLALPGSFKLHPLPDAARLAPWPKQRVTVDDRASLAAYANRFKDSRSILIADYDAGTISARLDWHGASETAAAGASTGPDDHSVTLRLRFSEEFDRWNAMSLGVSKKLYPQDEFARFLEENSVDVGYPEAASLVEIARDFEAVSGQTYKTSTRLDNGDRKLVYENESRITSNVIVPERFTVHIPIYNGEEPSDLVALFRWRANGQGGVMMGFDWHRVEYLRRGHFTQMAILAADETGLPVFMGRPA
jgi:hypothetical protein